MLFNSINYLVFLPIVFLLYWKVFNKNLKLQNLFLLFCSYFFYSCWDWRFLFLLLFSTLLDYFSGIMIGKSENKSRRKFWLFLSIIINLGFLGFFKYYNFFIESFADLLSSFEFQPHVWTLKVILPIGISFYTFHGLSYVIDIYKNRIPVEKNFVEYSLFVSYFPLLVAGPIERATHLLPQVKKKREFNYSQVTDGLRQILWGMFKKVVIADNCAHYANMIFENSEAYNGSTLLLGAIFFTFQIYGDFSGYSDIALGSSKLLGIKLLRNFNYPYFSRDIAEFWRRWHISLSSWFKDYLYIPLGGSHGGTWMRVRNTFIIFLVSGFWHGANWTFIIWGGLHALYIMPSIIIKTNRKHVDIVANNSFFPSFRELFNMGITFILVVLGWIFFRAEDVHHAFSYIIRMFQTYNISIGYPKKLLYGDFKIIFFIFIMIVMEWLMRRREYPLKIGDKNKIVRWSLYIIFILIIIWYAGDQEEFIYFQF